jgi:hypothetical protein
MPRKSNTSATPETASTPAVTPGLASEARGPKPNLKYVGRPRWDAGKRKRLDRNEPIESFSDRGEIVELPSAAAQERRRVFYHERAGEIVRLFPHLYKIVRSK